ncbi:hypothetical protein GLE_0512 [Lysobacter enzymogenes]|uniref:Uncharacterized protein n=1 Tax=Lysobacter enzymogenes TaxID=69 RepID=A0A0S2DBF8_LYSEN|nr:hypothetical protein [Lysobacter enzymogenes]ALN55870.1 hypothetical protein GLE_0512 [Lysobacter enzymogenes]QCW24844.1 hypothetical protein FE772_03285 [Lysobacter enzymogenes]
MRATRWIRQFHRWTSVVFFLCVIATTIALAQERPLLWMSYLPLAPLALLALTGLYLFALPYLPQRELPRREDWRDEAPR